MLALEQDSWATKPTLDQETGKEAAFHPSAIFYIAKTFGSVYFDFHRFSVMCLIEIILLRG